MDLLDSPATHFLSLCAQETAQVSEFPSNVHGSGALGGGALGGGEGAQGRGPPQRCSQSSKVRKTLMAVNRTRISTRDLQKQRILLIVCAGGRMATRSQPAWST